MGFLVCLALQVVGINGLVQVEYCVQFWPSHYQKDSNKLEEAWRRVAKIVKKAEGLTCEGRLQKVKHIA